MAFRTPIGENGLMFAFPLFYPFAQVFMAGEAERSLSTGHDPFDVAAMGIMARKAFPLRKGGMVRSSCHLFHQVAVTPDTHLRGRPMEQVLFIRAMGRMTRVTVGICNGLVGVSFREFRFCIGVAGIANPVHALLQEALEIGPMGIMTGRALILSKRDMNRLRFPSFPGGCVACVAKVSVFCRQQSFHFGCMGGMTGKATPFIQDRGMFHRHIFFFLRVAIKTQQVPFLDEKFSAFRSMSRVAGRAHSILERTVFHEASCLQRGSLMAVRTQFISALGCFKRLFRRRRLVAGIAPFLHRSVEARFHQFRLQ